MSPLADAAAAISGRSSAAEPTRPPPSRPAFARNCARVSPAAAAVSPQRAVRVERVDVHVHAHHPWMNPVAATAASISCLLLASSSAPGAGWDDAPSA